MTWRSPRRAIKSKQAFYPISILYAVISCVAYFLVWLCYLMKQVPHNGLRLSRHLFLTLRTTDFDLPFSFGDP